ncbi:IclR family transcriptional regulator [Bacillaceae bacterium SIJ1]|uniref:IclR family transcriptional regulator n=1 Tax=Litoribacterium kuwaitense TaxID=1398745 RepID=UPI001BAD4016|nr:IclR family transcriptional regulator [Litoribacterium kuwaitense]NGP45887.1 IclR family transcriptional regulator [Litoribacterium kuwaitense]
MTMKEMHEPTIHAVVHVLQAFEPHDFDLTAKSVAEKTGLSEHEATRLLHLLAQQNMINYKETTNSYHLSKEMYILGMTAAQSLTVRDCARPFMDELRNITKETVNLFMIDGRERMCLEQSEGEHDVRVWVKIGTKLPLWRGAAGKALLAHQSDSFISAILHENVPPFDRAPLFDELVQIKQNGVAESIDGREPGASAVAAPIFDGEGEVRASLSISGATDRFTPEKIDAYVELVKGFANAISEELGYSASLYQSNVKV